MLNCFKHSLKYYLTKLTSFLIFTSFLLVYFFSYNNIYAENPQKDGQSLLVPMGNVLQIDAELKNIIVGKEAIGISLKEGDVVTQIDGKSIDGYDDFKNTLDEKSDSQKVKITFKRNGQELYINCKKENLTQVVFNNFISGFATLTCINPETNEFAAVAHPISVCNSMKIPIKNGEISNTEEVLIEKSFRGNVGSLSAQKSEVIGSFGTNTDFGIRGTISNLDISQFTPYKVASYDEIKKGPAQIILQTGSNGTQKYDIEIVSIDNQTKPKAKSFKIKITDEKLLKLTGGIVQGMSGTPIIQNDKIIGAISHAVENDPSLGYGLFIQWMF
ncbi:MAG: PDZ domain-containing protein [Clostridioides sp.]|jgi:stage IV sporulation protein B|nr:PDZ domain-containing protein [Clostridioides sp.]